MNCLDKVVFLDRDGVINEDVNYLSNVNQLKLIDGSKEAIKILKDNGYKVIVVTNQNGIAKGYLSISDLEEIHKVLNKMLDNQIDCFLFCSHSPKDMCVCRKPNIGLFEMARMEFDIDFSKSFMVGDKTTDIQAGFNARLITIAVKTGYGETPPYASYVAENLLEAVRTIICKQQ
jgi:D-glycero-D-manno-heptose 1,7-bisphosphate phosphatase